MPGAPCWQSGPSLSWPRTAGPSLCVLGSPLPLLTFYRTPAQLHPKTEPEVLLSCSANIELQWPEQDASALLHSLPCVHSNKKRLTPPPSAPKLLSQDNGTAEEVEINERRRSAVLPGNIRSITNKDPPAVIYIKLSSLQGEP